MKAVWKYGLNPGITAVQMPKQAQVLAVNSQGDTAQLWALVEPDMAPEVRYFLTVATGEPSTTLQHMSDYIGTFFIHGGLVFHTFEVPADRVR